MRSSQDVDITRLLVSFVPRQKLEGVDHYIRELPTFCPRCRNSALATVCGKASWVQSYDGDSPEPEAVVEVPVRCCICDQLYVALYATMHEGAFGDGSSQGWSDPHFFATVPPAIAPTLPSKTIMKISPSFSKIFDETVAAELAGLTELLGAGYRRALEFLVKDYLIFKNPERADVIKRTFLANCIKDNIDDDTITELADKAVSIGNDFTHFERRGVHEVADLKGLIVLVRRWVEFKEDAALARARFSSDVRPAELRVGLAVDDLTSGPTSKGG
jgi:hypothetical protein